LNERQQHMRDILVRGEENRRLYTPLFPYFHYLLVRNNYLCFDRYILVFYRLVLAESTRMTNADVEIYKITV
jgi:hypothetical protein